jgi:hypothetical protein
VSVDPADYVAEILGEPSASMRNPANADYQCPFINSECTKRAQSVTGPYPVCSALRHEGKKTKTRRFVCLCPKRFFEAEILPEVVNRCWPGPPPENPQYVHEIKMSQFGNVDFVVADIKDGKVLQFVSVETQAIDITGSLYPAYEALTSNQMLDHPPSFGLNYANVYKRYVTQLIGKGYFHHHWQTKIVSVVQDIVFDDIQKRTNFPSIPLAQANIVFMSYRFEFDQVEARFKPILDKVVGTHHSNLQNAVLYQTPPSREKFCERIELQLKKGRAHVGPPDEINMAEESAALFEPPPDGTEET